MYRLETSEVTQGIEARLLREYNDLPFADQIDFLGKIFENSDYLLLASACNSISHSIFKKSMEIAALPLSVENNEAMTELWRHMDKIAEEGKWLHDIVIKEQKKRWERINNV